MTGNNIQQDLDLVHNYIDACTDWHESGDGFGATSQITGAGAVEAVETLFSSLHGNRPALLTASATYGIRSALKASGVGPGDFVLMSSYDWPASCAATLSLGAIPRLLRADPLTLTIDPKAITEANTRGAKAVCITHIFGIPSDVPAIKAKLRPGVAIIEDCAQALGSSLDGRPTGTLDSDYAIFSFGPGKQCDAGEGGMILSRDWDAFERVLRETQHPVRQIKNGCDDVNLCGLSIRPHPMTAILLLHAMKRYYVSSLQNHFESLAKKLSHEAHCHPIGLDIRRRNAQGRVPVFLDPGCVELGSQYSCTQSGAFDLWTMQPPKKPVLLVGINKRFQNLTKETSNDSSR